MCRWCLFLCSCSNCVELAHFNFDQEALWMGQQHGEPYWCACSRVYQISKHDIRTLANHTTQMDETFEITTNLVGNKTLTSPRTCVLKMQLREKQLLLSSTPSKPWTMVWACPNPCSGFVCLVTMFQLMCYSLFECAHRDQSNAKGLPH